MSQYPVPSSPSAALRTSVALLGALRLGFSGWAAARPRQVASGVGVSDEQVEAAVPYVRALAARELALAVGALVAFRRGRPGTFWVASMAASDLFDAVVYELLAELGTLDRARARRSALLALSGAVPEAATAVALGRQT
jgi:hypothetical protein